MLNLTEEHWRCDDYPSNVVKRHISPKYKVRLADVYGPTVEDIQQFRHLIAISPKLLKFVKLIKDKTACQCFSVAGSENCLHCAAFKLIAEVERKHE